MSGENGRAREDPGAQQLLPRHRYMLHKVDSAFGIYDEGSTEIMFLQPGVIDKVGELRKALGVVKCLARYAMMDDLPLLPAFDAQLRKKTVLLASRSGYSLDGITGR